MESLKSNPIIDKAYLPSTKMDHISYFNRALKFAQTNYQDHLEKITKLDPRNMTSTNFFEEYVQVLMYLKNGICKDRKEFLEIAVKLSPYTRSFWDLNSFPKKEQMQEIPLDAVQLSHVHTTAQIINQGIRLFGWTDYRNKFLNSTDRLLVLPGLGLKGARILGQNMGCMYQPDEIQELITLSQKLGFEDARALCMGIQKHFTMSWRTIGTVLWYSAVTFKDA